MKALNIYIFIYLFQLFIYTSCKKTTSIDTTPIIPFKYEDHTKGVKLSQNITEINFIELNKTFAPSILPGIVKCRFDKYFMLWRYNKLGIFSKDGTLLDSLISNQNTPNYIGNIFDFEYTQDSLFVLTGDRIFIFTNHNFNKYVRKIDLPTFYNSFSIYNQGFLLYSPTDNSFLTYINQSGELTGQNFNTKDWPVIRGDLFPHFSFFDKKILFFHPYNPTIFKIDNLDGSIQKLLTVDMGSYVLTPEESSSLLNNPKDHVNEMNIVNKKYCFFDDVNYLKNGLIYTFKINGKFFYNIYSEHSTSSLTFNHFLNDTNIPFMNDKGLLDLVSTDNNNKLIFYLEGEFLINTMQKYGNAKKGVYVTSNWDTIKDQITMKSGPIFAVMTLKDIGLKIE